MWEKIAEQVSGELVAVAFQQFKHAGFIRYRFMSPRSEVRVAISSIMRLETRGRYFLVKNLHYTETYGPFGGVMKHLPNATPDLDRYSFRPENLGPGADMVGDLRGYVPRGQLGAFLKWTRNGEARETGPDCLRRELREELKEVSVTLHPPTHLDFRKIRSVTEGPSTVPGTGVLQYRVFDVFEPIATPRFSRFVEKLAAEAGRNPGLLMVDGDELLRGRARDGRVVAHHADYLIGHRRIHPDDRPLVPASMATD